MFEISANGASVPCALFDRKRDADFSVFVDQFTGTVTVDKVTTGAAPEDVGAHASSTWIDVGEGSPER